MIVLGKFCSKVAERRRLPTLLNEKKGFNGFFI